MTCTPTLFDTIPRARNMDPDTSHEAAKAPRKRQIMTILESFAQSPMTDEEASTVSGISQAWKRCSDLRKLGWIKDTGIRKQSLAGKLAMVSIITPDGLTALKSLWV